MSNSSNLPHPQVLKCPECDYYCLSNNQMCRHIFTTQHTLARCQLCPTLLVCWGFAPGVKKLFDKARRTTEGAPVVDTVEHHMELTQHPCHGLVRSKDAFFVPGPPERYNVVPEPSTIPPVDGSAGNKFRCPDCINLIATWTQMTRHLDATKHSLARCATCALSLKCYGPAQPQRHEKMTGHSGFYGTFLQKSDYFVQGNVRRRCNVPQYRCHCGITFLEPLQLAEHFESAHRCVPFTKSTCLECGMDGSVVEMLHHMSSHETGHRQYSTEGFVEREYLVRLPSLSHVVGKDATAAAAEGDGSVSSSLSTPPAAGGGAGGEPSSGAGAASSSSNVAPVCPNGRILYQCPSCWFIFSSWNRLEAHLVQTKHGLSYCCECNLFLRPRERGDHTTATGHMNLYGPHMARSEYEVMVNLDDDALRQQLDCEEASMPEVASLRVVWRCPHAACTLLFHSFHMLEHHVESTGHGCTVCPVCLEIVSVLDGDMRLHEHPLPDLPEALFGITSEVNLQTMATDEELCTASPLLYDMCGECGIAVPKQHMQLHRSAGECLARRAKLNGKEELWDGVTRQSDIGGRSDGGSSGANGLALHSHSHSSHSRSPQGTATAQELILAQHHHQQQQQQQQQQPASMMLVAPAQPQVLMMPQLAHGSSAEWQHHHHHHPHMAAAVPQTKPAYVVLSTGWPS